jgi:hypothetical protein
VIPREYIGALDLAAAYGIRKLIAVPCIGEKEKAIEWHIKLSKIRVGAERQVVGNDACEWPYETKAILALDAIGFGENCNQFHWKLHLQALLRCQDVMRSRSSSECAIG